MNCGWLQVCLFAQVDGPDLQANPFLLTETSKNSLHLSLRSIAICNKNSRSPSPPFSYRELEIESVQYSRISVSVFTVLGSEFCDVQQNFWPSRMEFTFRLLGWVSIGHRGIWKCRWWKDGISSVCQRQWFVGSIGWLFKDLEILWLVGEDTTPLKSVEKLGAALEAYSH